MYGLLWMCMLLSIVSAIPTYTKPNILLLLADDLGYGDIWGNPVANTPNLDRLAAKGMKLKQMHSPNPLCTPSRASLLTGRLAVRMGLAGDFDVNPIKATAGVLPCDSPHGLPKDELTIAHYLKSAGYTTYLIGKWHLGNTPDFLPGNGNYGFDEYLGLPYSIDSGYFKTKTECLVDTEDCPYLPLLHNQEIIQQPVNRFELNSMFLYKIEEIINYSVINDFPFYIQVGFLQIHITCEGIPFNVDNQLLNAYVTSVEELDTLVGAIYDIVDKYQLLDTTIIIFTSDNGPLILDGLNTGCLGSFQGIYGIKEYGYTNVGKCSTWGGGIRIPGIISYPPLIKPNTVNNIVTSLLDILPTLVDLLRIPLNDSKIIDGLSLLPSLISDGNVSELKNRLLFIYRGGGCYAVRWTKYMFHFATQGGCLSEATGINHNVPLVFNVEEDPSERNNINSFIPFSFYKFIYKHLDAHLLTLNPPPSLLKDRNIKNILCCNITNNCRCNQDTINI